MHTHTEKIMTYCLGHNCLWNILCPEVPREVQSSESNTCTSVAKEMKVFYLSRQTSGPIHALSLFLKY